MQSDNIHGELSAGATLQGSLNNNTARMSGFLHEGFGGTSDYNELENKPSINGVTLEGNVSGFDIGIYPPVNYSTTPQNTFTRWIDGRYIWQVVIPFTDMYEGMELSIPRPSNIRVNEVITINGMAGSDGGEYFTTVPYYSSSNYNIRAYFHNVNDTIYFETTEEQRQYYYKGYVVVRYTLA